MLMDTQRNKEQKQENDVHKKIGEGIGFERTRRITGYLVGTLDRFNNAKRAEERDRVKHSV
jgi:anaerobic ribonucleoside-triphosphate reductase